MNDMKNLDNNHKDVIDDILEHNDNQNSLSQLKKQQNIQNILNNFTT